MTSEREKKLVCFVVSPIGKEHSAERYNANIVPEYIIAPALADFEKSPAARDWLAMKWIVVVQQPLNAFMA